MYQAMCSPTTYIRQLLGLMKKTTSIKFVDPPNHISNHLTHWTGRGKSDDEAFDIICKIVKSEKLKLSQCPNNFENEEEIKLGVPMVCFTETPIEHSLEHCERFGRFGIGFDKQDMIKLGANPVLYLVNNRKYYQEKLRDFYWVELKEKYGAQTEIPFEIKNNLSWFLSSTQPYTDNSKGKTREYYSQREWRIVRVLPFGTTNGEIKRWGVIKDGFNMNELKCDHEQRKINGIEQPTLFAWLSYSKTSIKYIAVPKKYADAALKLKDEENLSDCDILLI
jgi:hypothetical protein